MLKKILILFICVFIFCGCCEKKDVEEISFASWGSVTEVKILKNVIKNFEKENPNIKINFIHIPQNYFQKLHLLFASNSAPDVLFINNLYLPVYANHLFDLTDKFNEKDFYKQSFEGLSYNKKLFAVPRDISNLIFYVNTDIVTLPSKDWKIEDLLEISTKIANSETFGISFEEDIYWAQPYLAYYGEVFDENFDPKKSKGLNFYIDLRDKYKIAPTKSQVGSSTLAQMFLDGKIAFYLSGRWLYPKISEKADFNWSVITFPNSNNLQPCDSSGWAISKNSSHKESSLKFIKYLSSKETSKYFLETGLIVPARIEVACELNNLKHNEKAFLEAIEISKNIQIPLNYKKLSDKINKNFN